MGDKSETGSTSLSLLTIQQEQTTLKSRATWRPVERRNTIRSPDETTTASAAASTLLSFNPLLKSLWMGDVVVALTVTASVAPLLTIVNKAIVEQSARSGERSVLWQSMARTAASIGTNPVGYYRSPTFGFMWMGGKPVLLMGGSFWRRSFVRTFAMVDSDNDNDNRGDTMRG